MEQHDQHLQQYIREQIALEEQLYRVLETQLQAIDQNEFPDAQKLLAEANTVLEEQFRNLNSILDKFENDNSDPSGLQSQNGSKHNAMLDHRQESQRLSRILRDDYSALNLVTMSNTLLHTTALALKRDEVATLALKHLENLVPIVVKLGELVPGIVARELRLESREIDPDVAKIALENTKLVWRKAF